MVIAAAVSPAIVVPAASHLAAYRDALQRGWSPDNVRGAVAAREELAAIAADAAAFVRSLDDPEGAGPAIQLPDGSTARRLPSIRRWIWQDGFCGSIGLRWQDGTSALPAHVLGHIGFAVVPWRQRQGLARQALALMLPEARLRGLDHVELTTTPDNIASQAVIKANGGQFVAAFDKGAAYGGGTALRFRITL